MPARIVTDSRGHRWDVRQDRGGGELVFRHQSGRELRTESGSPLDAQSTEDLLNRLDEARRREGYDAVGHGGLDVALDDEGYETGAR